MRKWMTVLLICLAPGVSESGATGKIMGSVTEEVNKQTLPGANVVLKGGLVPMGAVSSANGQYVILNVPPGTYTLSCSYIGFQEIIIKEVLIAPDMTTRINFALVAATLDQKTMEVIAPRPLIQKDQTSSVRLITSQEIVNLPARDIQEIATLQAGVIEWNDNLYVRGGRLAEVDYIVDGVSQRDIQTGISATAINSNAIDQIVIIVGGFEAEYGRVMSGVVKVVTKEGQRNYTGTAEYITDGAGGHTWLGAPSFGFNTGSLALGGPIVPKSDRLFFFSSGEWRHHTDRAPRNTVLTFPIEEGRLDPNTKATLNDGLLPHNSLNAWTGQVKLTVRLTDELTVKTGFVGAKERRESYVHTFRYDLAHAPLAKANNHSFFADLTCMLGTRAFFTLSANSFYRRYNSGDGIYLENLFDYGRPDGNPLFDSETLFWQGDDPATPITRDNNGFIIGDEGHVSDSASQRGTETLTPIDFALTSQITTHHQIKAGFDLQLYRLRYFNHFIPTLSYRGPYNGPQDPGGFFDVNRYGYNFDWDTRQMVNLGTGRDATRKPILAAAFLQDKVEYEGLVINAGLRYDYINTRTQALQNESDPLGPDARLTEEDLIPSPTYHRFSPRIGIGFPITDATVFHLNFGIFYQQPTLQNVYVGYDFLEYQVPRSHAPRPVGNPNLKPEQTSAYEIGVVHQLDENTTVDITAYHKSVKDLVQVTAMRGSQALYLSYKNRDYGTIKGVDVNLYTRRKKRISAQIAYGLSHATGTGSHADSQQKIAWSYLHGVGQPPKTVAPLNFDQRHKVSASIDYRFGIDDGPRLWGRYVLANAGINFLLRLGSGFPYTPTRSSSVLMVGSGQTTGPLNSSRGPWSYQMDLKASKVLQLGRARFNAYLWGINILNKRNTTTVYSATGNADTTGWLNTNDGREYIKRFGEEGKEKYRVKEADPMLSGQPRQIRLGLACGF